MNSAIFLDRDGVLVEDVHLLTREEDIRILPSVSESIRQLKQAGYKCIVVSNQAVVARGLLTEEEMHSLHRAIESRLIEMGAPPFDGFYACPHHPNADCLPYRVECNCRKPRPGLLLRAQDELGIDCSSSYMVGDRMTDIHAGVAAGCKTILLKTGEHTAPPIVTIDPLDENVQPDFVCNSLEEAVSWILTTPYVP